MKNLFGQIFVEIKTAGKTGRVRALDEQIYFAAPELPRDDFPDRVFKFRQMARQPRGDLEKLMIDALDLGADEPVCPF